MRHDRSLYLKSSDRCVQVCDILEYTAEHEEIRILFSVDFEKDLTESKIHLLSSPLSKEFRFGPQFIHYVRTFLKNAESCVMSNGHSTGYISLKEGTKDGDTTVALPLHPLLGDTTHSSNRKL